MEKVKFLLLSKISFNRETWYINQCIFYDQKKNGFIWVLRSFHHSSKQFFKGGDQLSQLPSNEDLALEGSHIIKQSLCAYVRWALPYLPEEGVQAVVKFLTTDQLLAHVSFHIGTLDLIMTVDYPPSPKILKKVFEAIIGALASSDKVPFIYYGSTFITHFKIFHKNCYFFVKTK